MGKQMNARKSLFAILVTVCFALVQGCAGSESPPDPTKIQEQITATLGEERELIRTTVTDESRAEALIDLLAERDRLLVEYGDVVSSYRKRITALSADYNADRASFDKAIFDYNANRLKTQQALAELIDAMKRETTAEEWHEIAKFQAKQLNARDFAYDNIG